MFNKWKFPSFQQILASCSLRHAFQALNWDQELLSSWKRKMKRKKLSQAAESILQTQLCPLLFRRKINPVPSAAGLGLTPGVKACSPSLTS